MLQVIAQILGGETLPWEGKLPPDVESKLGAFQKPVLQLLQRDPSHRMSTHKFHVACIKLFAKKATTDMMEYRHDEA